MVRKRLGLTGLLLGIGLAMSACTDGYGYTGLGVGYGAGGFADPYYGDAFGGPAGFGGVPFAGGVAPLGGFGGGPFGWYGNYYYPGTGVFVYDRLRRPYRWNAGQRRYWEGRRAAVRGGAIRNDWSGFRGRGGPGIGNRPGNRPGYRAGAPGVRGVTTPRATPRAVPRAGRSDRGASTRAGRGYGGGARMSRGGGRRGGR